jgi:hypothetical protein
MATVKQKRVAKLIIENSTLDKPLTGGQMLEKVSYSPGIQKQPSRILESDGVREALTEYGFSEDNAKRVVSEILLNEEERAETRLNAAKEVFKVHGTYAAEKSTTFNLNVEADITDKTELDLLREQFEKQLKDNLIK